MFSRLRAAFRRHRAAPRGVAAHLRQVIDLAEAEARVSGPAVRSTGQRPLISFVVPVYDTSPRYLTALLASFQTQPVHLCELVLSDDGSTSHQTRTWLTRHASAAGMRIVSSKSNRGIAAASNQGIAHATGDWVAFVDHDDALAPFAVDRIARTLASAPDCQFLYTDEVITDGRLRPVDYFLKPAWDPVLLSGVNYVNHLSVYRRERLLQIGGLREGFQGSQDYDLLLRYTRDLADKDILHLPYPAYFWRRDGASFSARFLETATASARRTLAEFYAQEHRSPPIERALSTDLHRVRFDLDRPDWPLVSVVIPSREALPLIANVLDGLTKRTDYPALEVIVVDNGSKEPDVLALYERHRHGSVPFAAHIEEEDFNFSRSVNRGITIAKGDFVLLLNNDIEIIEPGWLKEMVSCFDYPDTGIVGAKLLYPDGTIQHAGVIAGLGGLAGHWFVGQGTDFPGPMGRLRVRQSLSAVTGAAMLISRSCIERTGVFDEDVFGIAYNDVDYCLRAVGRRFRVVWTPFATLVHHESASRGSDEVPERIARFRRDQERLRTRHRTETFEDRAFNPWYSKNRSDPVPVLLDRLPRAR